MLAHASLLCSRYSRACALSLGNSASQNKLWMIQIPSRQNLNIQLERQFGLIQNQMMNLDFGLKDDVKIQWIKFNQFQEKSDGFQSILD